MVKRTGIRNRPRNQYYCNKCKSYHYKDSKIGQKHRGMGQVKSVKVIKSFTMEDWWNNLSKRQKSKILHDKFGLSGNELIGASMDDWEDFSYFYRKEADMLREIKYNKKTKF